MVHDATRHLLFSLKDGSRYAYERGVPVSDVTLGQAVRRGRLACRRSRQGHVFIEQADLDAFLDERLAARGRAERLPTAAGAAASHLAHGRGAGGGHFPSGGGR